jgi:hypothetical protein
MRERLWNYYAVGQSRDLATKNAGALHFQTPAPLCASFFLARPFFLYRSPPTTPAAQDDDAEDEDEDDDGDDEDDDDDDDDEWPVSRACMYYRGHATRMLRATEISAELVSRDNRVCLFPFFASLTRFFFLSLCGAVAFA